MDSKYRQIVLRSVGVLLLKLSVELFCLIQNGCWQKQKLKTNCMCSHVIFIIYFKYHTHAIITQAWFETALDYKPQILGPTFLVGAIQKLRGQDFDHFWLPTYLILLQRICYSCWTNRARNGVISIGQWGVFNHEKGAISQSHLATQIEGVVTSIIFPDHKTKVVWLEKITLQPPHTVLKSILHCHLGLL